MEQPVSQWRPVFPTLVLATFLVAMLGTAQGQSGSVSDPLLPGTVNETEVATDPSGDVSMSGMVIGPPSPPTDLDAPVDVLALRVAETEGALLLSLQHRGYPATAAQVYNSDPSYYYSCSIDFRAGERGYAVYLYRDCGQSGGAWVVQAGLWRYDDEGEGDVMLQAALVNDDHFEIVLPKEYILYGEHGRALRVGDKLTDFFIWCSQSSIAMRTYDYHFDMSTPFKITLAQGTADVAVRFPTAGFGGISVLPGQPNRFPVEIVNLADRKLLVNFTAELVDASGAPLADWKIHHANDLEVKRSGIVNASVVVTPPAGTPHREGGILKVRALPLGSETPALADRPVRAVVTPSPTNNTLYFHNSPYSHQFCLPACGGQVPPLLADQQHFFFLNVLQTDPEYGEAPTQSVGAPLEFSSVHVALDAPLALPITLHAEEPVEVAIALRSGFARPIQLGIEMYVEGPEGGYFGHAEKVVEVTGEFTAHTLSFEHAFEGAVPAGHTLYGYIYPQETETAGAPMVVGLPLDDIEWDPSQSHIKLPIADNPRPDLVITDGRFLPSILLANGTESEEYLNPGKATAFDLLLLNEGTAEDVLGLSTTFSAPGWTATAYPGDRFQLTPGRNAPLCLEVQAPANAAPNTVVDLNLTATSRNDAEVRTSATLRLLVADGVEIEPAYCTERVDTSSEDYVNPYEEERDSPAPAALALLATLALAVALRRRL